MLMCCVCDVLCECVSVVALGSLVTSGGSHWGEKHESGAGESHTCYRH